MKLNKKQKKIGIISLIVIGALIISIIGFSSLSLIYQAQVLDWSNKDVDSWSCSTTNSGSPVTPTIPGEKFDITIRKDNTATYFSAICSKMDSLAGFNCYTDNPLVASHPEYSASTRYAWYGDDFKREMGKQLIIIEAGGLKFYGLCNLGQDQNCEITAPEGVQNIKAEDQYSEPRVIVTSCEINFKKNGYTESDFPINYYRILGNECKNIYISPLEKTINDYPTLEECESKIIPTYKTYYRLNNSCSAIYLISSENTTNDYKTYEECQSNITEEIGQEKLEGNTPMLVISIILIILVIGVLSLVYLKIKKR